MASVTVWLFVECHDLSLAELTTSIGVAPDDAHSAGEPRGKSRKTWETNSWCLKSTVEVDEDPDQIATQTEYLVMAVLDRVKHVQERFRAVAHGRTGGLLIGFSASFKPPIILRPTTLAAIAALGVDLEIDLV